MSEGDAVTTIIDKCSIYYCFSKIRTNIHTHTLSL